MHRRRVLGDHIRYVGLDVHKDGIVVAVAESGLRGRSPRIWSGRQHADSVAAAGRKLGGEGVRLRFCYEDGVIPARRYRFR